MARDQQHKPDPDDDAARVVAGAEARQAASAPSDREAAWRDWSSRIQDVDEPGMALLRSAFEAGYEARDKQDAG